MAGELLIAGEHIKAGSSVVRSLIDGKAYPAGETAGEYIGDAVEDCREGFRIYVPENGEIREDDA
jgi:predicted transcriptional regulator